MNKATLKSWRFWVYGLASAFIGGGATAIVAMGIAPDTFNLKDTHKLFEMMIGAGIINAVMYLKQSPLPKLPMDENENQTPIPPGA